jgi:hypothetical protein
VCGIALSQARIRQHDDWASLASHGVTALWSVSVVWSGAKGYLEWLVLGCWLLIGSGAAVARTLAHPGLVPMGKSGAMLAAARACANVRPNHVWLGRMREMNKISRTKASKPTWLLVAACRRDARQLSALSQPRKFEYPFLVKHPGQPVLPVLCPSFSG